MNRNPPLRPPAWPDATDNPPAGARCSRCGGSAWWTEAASPRFGWLLLLHSRAAPDCRIADRRGRFALARWRHATTGCVYSMI